jgi:hypothetical protein
MKLTREDGDVREGSLGDRWWLAGAYPVVSSGH